MKALPTTWLRQESVANSALVVLSIFSAANPVIAQAAALVLPNPIAGLNIMQWFQGLCFVAILIALPRMPKGWVELSRPFSRLLWVYVVSLGLLHFRLLSTGRLSLDVASTERVVYFKVVFALLLWYCASCLVRSHESARLLLRSVVWGAAASAAWILICYFTGVGSANHAVEGIRATAGSEGVSGKAMAGFLLPATGGAMFLAVREGSHRWALYAAVMAIAVFVTFDRSAQVAFVVGLSWMMIWRLGLASSKRCSKTILLFLIVLIVLGGVYYAHHGSEELVARWTHDFDRGEIGSGRGTFYTAAWDWFWRDADLADFLLGMGYGNISDLMHSRSGIYRHTHSDLFDMLLMGGIVGLVLYSLLFCTVARLASGLSCGSLEFAIFVAILMSFGVMSLLTGLMAFPHTMYAFGAQCICLRVLAFQEEDDLGRSFLGTCPGSPTSIRAAATSRDTDDLLF